jgi:MFS family permease
MFRSIKHRNFRIFFMGQAISVLGTWMQIVAVSWLAYRLTNSPFMLGCVAFASQIPSLFLAPVAGVVSDRFDRRKLLILAQSLSMVQAIILTVLVLTNTISIVHILCLSLFLGIINAFEMTIRQSYLIELVEDKRDLSNAIALNSMMFNGSRLLGPAIAGILIVSFGEGVCFLINACSYASVILALGFIKTAPGKICKASAMDIGREFLEGVRYALGFLPIRLLLLVIALFSVVGTVLQTLLPVVVKETFHGGPAMFGSLLTISGVGAVTSTIYMARQKTIAGFVEKIALAVVVMGVGLALFAATQVYWVACAASFMIGLTMMVGISGGNIVLQTLVQDDKRGRVMSLYALALMGTAPFGSLGAGILAAKFGAGMTIALASLISFIGAFLFWRKLGRYHLKAGPICVEKDIVPEV